MKSETMGRGSLACIGFARCACLLTLISMTTASISGQTLDEAFEIVEKAVQDGSIPGASALVMRHGEVLEHRALGACELEPRRAFEADTICWIASLTKPITATAAMKLVEAGELDLDEPIANYLPELAELRTNDGVKREVTIRQLMSHSSGIPASVPLRPSYFFTQQWFDRTLPEVVEAIATRPLDFAPGSDTHYSNAAPYVLGRIIEVTSGQQLDAFVQAQIFEPLQMNTTGFAVAAENHDRTAVVYRREGQQLSVYCRYDPQWQVHMTMPDGGLFSTAMDIAKFANSFLDNQKSVLQEGTVRQMLTKQNEDYGLGWILDKPNQFSHWGSSGTLVWADQQTGVVGVFFSQIQDFDLLARLRERFRNAVDAAVEKNL
jgi:CubicO group peptidase (beta-lactamase class C family)